MYFIVVQPQFTNVPYRKSNDIFCDRIDHHQLQLLLPSLFSESLLPLRTHKFRFYFNETHCSRIYCIAVSSSFRSISAAIPMEEIEEQIKCRDQESSALLPIYWRYITRSQWLRSIQTSINAYNVAYSYLKVTKKEKMTTKSRKRPRRDHHI